MPALLGLRFLRPCVGMRQPRKQMMLAGTPPVRSTAFRGIAVEDSATDLIAHDGPRRGGGLLVVEPQHPSSCCVFKRTATPTRSAQPCLQTRSAQNRSQVTV